MSSSSTVPPARARFRLAETVRTVELEGELVLLDLARGEYFGLGEVGTRAWGGLSRGQSIGDVARELASGEGGYDVSVADLTGDLLRFARELEAAGLLVPLSNGAA